MPTRARGWELGSLDYRIQEPHISVITKIET